VRRDTLLARYRSLGQGYCAGFIHTSPFRSAPVQNQFAQFYDLFREGTQMRQDYNQALRYVGKLLLSGQSSDMQEGSRNRETV